MKRKHPILKRILSVALALALILPATVAMVGDSGSAQASTSLPYIEKLKQNGDTLSILEIVPQAGSGSIGYYIGGQEPIANWPEIAASKSSKAARESYVGTLFTALTGAGLLSDDTSTPLKLKSAYSEKYPWEAHTGYAEMKLDAVETADIQGTFTSASNSSGAFKQSNDFTFVSGGGGGADYVQNIDYFVPAGSAELASGTQYYYYNPTFTPITDISTVSAGTAVYINSATYADPAQPLLPEGYLYEGTVGASGFAGMEIGKPYYYVSQNTPPANTSTGVNTSYAAISSGYIKAADGQTGYFTASNPVYTYVGTGGGYNFAPDPNGGVHKLRYSSVYYTGGFTNNNWFKKYVFDWSVTEPEPTFTVKSVTPGNVTLSMVNSADLVVLSNGFVPGGSVTSAYSHANDLSPDMSAAIYNAVVNSGGADTNYNLPIIVDNAIVDNALLPAADTNIRTLATNIKTYTGSAKTSFVSASVFFFAADTTRTALATNQFAANYTQNDYAVSGSAFYPVYTEIQNENFLRKTANPNIAASGLLEESVSLARVIRYIINYAGKRVVEEKGTVNVLELQPGSGSYLTADMVKGWLGYASGSTAVSVNIDSMSTAEFIGKIDVVTEKYDMVYIGSKLDGINPTNLGATDYPGTDMDGLIYTGIGGTVTMDSNSVGWQMSGLLASDYSTTDSFSSNTYRKLIANDATRTFRYSGNDLTPTKTQELRDFINSGFPVVLANDLTTGDRHDASEAMTLKATAAVDSSNPSRLKATASGTNGEAIPAFFGPYYQWYSTDSSTVLGTDFTYTPPATATGEKIYYCKVSCTLDTKTYTATSNTVKATPKNTYNSSQVSNNNYPSQSGQYVSNTTNYTITVTGKSNNYTVSVTPSTAFTYNWEGYWTWLVWSGWESCGTANQPLNDSGHNPYRCNVTINGTTTSVPFNKNSSSTPSITSKDVTISTYAAFSVGVTPTPGESSASLTAATSPGGIGATYQWYTSNGSFYGNGATISGLISGSYFCQATVGSSTARSLTYTVSKTQNGYTFAVNSGGTLSNPIPAQPAANFDVNTATVDSSSYLYTLLNESRTKFNVMKQGSLDVAENKDKLKKYVNLSKPEIRFLTGDALPTGASAYPRKYSINDTTGVITSLTEKYTYPAEDPDLPDKKVYMLEYYFSIANDTDPDPANTRYTCYLYVDSNSDGRYNEGERLGDAVIRTWNSTKHTVGTIVNSTALKADTAYYVSRSMPVDKHGIVPWKLEIVKTGSLGTRTSIHNYTHIKTSTDSERVRLNILQIRDPATKNGSPGYSLADQMTVVTGGSYYSSVTQKYYAGIYGKLIADISGDYNITITTVPIADINSMTSWSRTINGTTVTYPSLLKYLESYDMLIAGFNDCYGDFTSNSAPAIAAYVEDNKPILFTHDTTSFYTLPFSNYQTTSSGNVSSGWGFYFNTIIRDAVGLDRYGVTSTTYGGNQPYLVNRPTQGLVANGYKNDGASTVNAADLGTLLSANYSVAFAPKSSRTGNSVVTQTQGYSRGLLDRFKSGDINNSQKTSAVSQVNEGQITTYPFNINTADFSSLAGAPATLPISETHFQYYQLNLNSADTVVWYCLYYNNASRTLYNDAINSYYIYTKGNVTYSGAGHTTSLTSVNGNVSEAKLFVNTMIAAYRVAQVAPTVKFTDQSGKKALSTYLIASDDAGTLVSASTGTSPSVDPLTNAANRIYFVVDDASIGSNKTISASFTYKSGALTDTVSVPIYDSQSAGKTSALISGLPYYVRLEDIWAALPDTVKANIENGIEIKLTVSSTVNGNTMSSFSTLTLRQQSLFSLS